jgi:hypothetical protein
MKSLGRIIHQLKEVVLLAVARGSLLLRQLDPHAPRDMFDRLGESEALGEREELEDVAAGPATEAVEESLRAVDCE